MQESHFPTKTPMIAWYHSAIALTLCVLLKNWATCLVVLSPFPKSQLGFFPKGGKKHEWKAPTSDAMNLRSDRRFLQTWRHTGGILAKAFASAANRLWKIDHTKKNHPIPNGFRWQCGLIRGVFHGICASHNRPTLTSVKCTPTGPRMHSDYMLRIPTCFGVAIKMMTSYFAPQTISKKLVATGIFLDGLLSSFHRSSQRVSSIAM